MRPSASSGRPRPKHSAGRSSRRRRRRAGRPRSKPALRALSEHRARLVRSRRARRRRRGGHRHRPGPNPRPLSRRRTSRSEGAFFDQALEYMQYAGVETRGGRFVVATSDRHMGRSLFVKAARPEFKALDRAVSIVEILLGESAVIGRLFVDVGANIGTTTIPALVAHRFGSAVCCEPEEENFLRILPDEHRSERPGEPGATRSRRCLESHGTVESCRDGGAWRPALGSHRARQGLAGGGDRRGGRAHLAGDERRRRRRRHPRRSGRPGHHRP